MLMRRILLAVSFCTFISPAVEAARSMPSMRTLPSDPTPFTYDFSGSSGTQNGVTYSEVTLNMNWYLTEWLNWRNGVFTRFGSNVKSVNGLDSSLLAAYNLKNDSGTLGFQAFAGPGVRLASADNSAATADAGVIFTLGGIRLGGGVKYLSYFNAREDLNNSVLPKNETQYFIVLSGGGSL